MVSPGPHRQPLEGHWLLFCHPGESAEAMLSYLLCQKLLQVISGGLGASLLSWRGV